MIYNTLENSDGALNAYLAAMNQSKIYELITNWMPTTPVSTVSSATNCATFWIPKKSTANTGYLLS